MLANSLWAARTSFLPVNSDGGLLQANEAVAKAASHVASTEDGLVVIGDGSDATTSGSPGDSTHLLRAVLGYRWPRGAAVAMISENGVAACQEAGVGAQVRISVGGVLDSTFSVPLEVHGVVERLFRAQFTIGEGHMNGMEVIRSLTEL